MKYKLIVLCGKAGSGKNTILDSVYISYPTPNKCHLVVSDTTRPIRSSGEIDGETYNFLTEKEFFNKEHLEITNFNNWYYGTPVESLLFDKINLAILNPSGIRQLFNQEEVPLEIKVFYINADDIVRQKRQLNRETIPNLEEINRRFLADKNDFENLPFPYTKLTNNTPANKHECVYTILDYISHIEL